MPRLQRSGLAFASTCIHSEQGSVLFRLSLQAVMHLGVGWRTLFTMETLLRPPTDVSDEEWAVLAPSLTLMREDAPQRLHPLHERFNGPRFIARTGRLSAAPAMVRRRGLHGYHHRSARTDQAPSSITIVRPSPRW
jgi:hypothetical protein